MNGYLQGLDNARDRLVAHRRVLALRVLTDADDVNVLVARLNRAKRLGMDDIGVQVQIVTQRQIAALVIGPLGDDVALDADLVARD